MTALPPPLVDIEDPLVGSGWRVSLPDDPGALHTEVLRELCASRTVLHVGGTGARGVAATLQLVDVMQQQLVLASDADGIAVARALQAKPVWAVALLHSLRVQFALVAARAEPAERTERDIRAAAAGRGPQFRIVAHWPREIHRTSRRGTPRVARGAHCDPVARFHHSNQLVSTREFALMNISEEGAAVLLPANMAPPALDSRIRRIELELDERHIVFTDARVRHVTVLRRGVHQLGIRWEGMPAAGQRVLRRWLAAAAAEPERIVAPLPGAVEPVRA